MQTIHQVLAKAYSILNNRLEIDLLLSHAMQVPREYLYTWPEKKISHLNENQFFELVYRRKSGEPIAYLLGKKEFWSLPLNVSQDVLIPRPETELVVEQLLNIIPKHNKNIRILDLGTGSGAIALAIAVECPHWQIIATDISSKALNIAKNNAKKLGVSNVEFYLGNWFKALDGLPMSQCLFNAVVSNPPYIPIGDPHLNEGDLRFEPQTALVSGIDGLKDLKKIIQNLDKYLASKGVLVVEHSFQQWLSVTTMMKTQGLIKVTTYKDLANVNRVTVGHKN